ncbi:IS1380 family transposase [Bacillus sp. FSL W7-1360]
MAILNEIRPTFNPNLKISASNERITSDAGVLMYKEVAHQLDYFIDLHETVHIPDHRSEPDHTHESVMEQLIFQRFGGYHTESAAKQLVHDPTMTQVLNKEALASQSTLTRFYQAIAPENIKEMDASLLHSSLKTIKSLNQEQITIDLDSTYFQTHGKQENRGYSGHYKTTGYHPLLAFDGETGLCLGAINRPGQEYTSNGASAMCANIIDQARKKLPRVNMLVRGDSGFAMPDLYDFCEARSVDYVIRLKANSVLHDQAEALRPDYDMNKNHEVHYKESVYKAGSWSRARRVMIRYERVPGELLFQHTFLVTNLEVNPEDVFSIYKQRGEMELFIKEAKNDFGCKFMHSHYFIPNCARMMISLIAYNLHITAKVLFAPDSVKRYRMSSFRSLFIKVGAKITKSGRYLHLKLSASFVHQKAFFEMMRNIQSWGRRHRMV